MTTHFFKPAGQLTMMFCKMACLISNKKNWSDNSKVKEKRIQRNKESCKNERPDNHRSKEALFILFNFVHRFYNTYNCARLSVCVEKWHGAGYMSAALLVREHAVVVAVFKNVAEFFNVIWCLLCQRLNIAQFNNCTVFFFVIYCIKNISARHIVWRNCCYININKFRSFCDIYKAFVCFIPFFIRPIFKPVIELLTVYISSRRLRKLFGNGSINYFKFLFKFAVCVITVQSTHKSSKHHRPKNQLKPKHRNPKLLFHQKTPLHQLYSIISGKRNFLKSTSSGRFPGKYHWLIQLRNRELGLQFRYRRCYHL